DGSVADWTYKRGLIADAVNRSGSFLDGGCASGYLMETMHEWCGERGYAIEPYGLDISPELADLARRRLPQWEDRIFVGNAIDWTPPQRFDFVRTGLDYVPPGDGAIWCSDCWRMWSPPAAGLSSVRTMRSTTKHAPSRRRPSA
ncbi:MAG: class I SAM-dependent methyltransferase, partial [Chloroflexia bacterium]